MTSPFNITEHVIEASYIRDYPRATATPEAPLKLCIKKYSPIDNPNPKPGDVTFVATHGTGFPKEVYEPLWEELLLRSKQHGFRIRAIWIADAVNQGASGILNEQHLGNDTSWFDHGRDTIHMISNFRSEMPRPIIGIGHSAGAVQLIFASLYHQRLFHSIILIEPFIIESPLKGNGGGLILLEMATKKRDKFPTREEAIKKSPHLRTWDKRTLQRWKEHGYRALPSTIYPYPSDTKTKTETEGVTYTTSKHQETMSYTYVNPRKPSVVQFPGEEYPSDQVGTNPERQLHRTEPVVASKLVAHLRPTTLFISGGKSPLYKAGTHSRAAQKTGTGFGGSGGGAAHVVVEKAGHSAPLEKVGDTAEAMGGWIARELAQWEEEEARIEREWGSLSIQEKSTLPLEWYETLEKAKNEHDKAKL